MKEQLRQMADEQVRSLSQVAYMLLRKALGEEGEAVNSSDGI